MNFRPMNAVSINGWSNFIGVSSPATIVISSSGRGYVRRMGAGDVQIDLIANGDGRRGSSSSGHAGLYLVGDASGILYSKPTGLSANIGFDADGEAAVRIHGTGLSKVEVTARGKGADTELGSGIAPIIVGADGVAYAVLAGAGSDAKINTTANGNGNLGKLGSGSVSVTLKSLGSAYLLLKPLGLANLAVQAAGRSIVLVNGSSLPAEIKLEGDGFGTVPINGSGNSFIELSVDGHGKLAVLGRGNIKKQLSGEGIGYLIMMNPRGLIRAPIVIDAVSKEVIANLGAGHAEIEFTAKYGIPFTIPKPDHFTPTHHSRALIVPADSRGVIVPRERRRA